MSQGSTSLPPRSGSRKTVKSPASNKKRKKHPILKAFLFLLFGLIILVGAGIAYLYMQTNEAIEQVGLPDAEVEKIPVSESVKQKPVAILLMGLDTRSGGGGLNTDVMMVAAFDPVTKSATVVTIPRDTKVDVEGYRARKANQFYADFYSVALKEDANRDKSKAELAGMSDAREAIGKLFGINISYSAVINFQGFVDVVDALGGVKVNVDKRMKYTDSHDGTDIDLQKGEQTLYGKDALDFVRYRQSNDGTNMSSDFERNERQAQVIGALTDNLKSLGTLTKLDSLFDAVGNNMKMDMPSSEIKRLLTTYFGISRSNITFIPLEGTWRSPYVHINEDSLNQTRAALKAIMDQ